MAWMVTGSESPTTATADDGPPLRLFRRHRWLAVACCVSLVVWAVFYWLPLGLIRPIYVVSGSMAPALCGPGYEIRCQSCGWSYRVGIESLPADGDVVCTNCGWQQACNKREMALPGHRVIIQRIPGKSIERWQIVAFRSPEDSRDIVKRVVGLPGEEIEIDAGDLLANDTRLRKTLNQMQQVAILVHDDRFRPSDPAVKMTRWLPAATVSGWSAADHGYGWTATQNDVEISTASIDWLSYHHADGLPPPFLRATPRADLRQLRLQPDLVTSPESGSRLFRVTPDRAAHVRSSATWRDRSPGASAILSETACRAGPYDSGLRRRHRDLLATRLR